MFQFVSVRWQSRLLALALYERSALCYRRFAWTICLSAHVSSGHPRRRIVTPFGVVSVVGLGSGVPDFGGDRRRGKGSFGVNKMQKWPIDRLLTRV